VPYAERQREVSVCITIPRKYKGADSPDLYLIEQDKYDRVEVGQGDTYDGMGPAFICDYTTVLARCSHRLS
jgi:hypothetical protein